jgi:predicted 3-demethylubiquinone-9 3-methyltransferase (glyoxalase superfamily)
MQRIKPCLWFEDRVDEAIEFYTSLFGDSAVDDVMRAGPDGPVISATFRLAGQEFMALNGRSGPGFTEAISLFVRCADQGEVDTLWKALTADGGEESPCGWLKDRFGVSWQIVPDRLMELLSDPDPGRAQRATRAMLQMQKIDIAGLEAAADAAS